MSVCKQHAGTGKTWCGLIIGDDIGPTMTMYVTKNWCNVTCPKCKEFMGYYAKQKILTPVEPKPAPEPDIEKCKAFWRKREW